MLMYQNKLCNIFNFSSSLVQIFFSSIYTTFVYFMAGLPYELLRFSLFNIICLLVCFVAEGMGLFVGAIFNVTVFIYKILYIMIKNMKINEFLVGNKVILMFNSTYHEESHIIINNNL